MTGLLVLAATPIGDVSDAPARLRDVLATADVVAAEDTRRYRRLAASLGVEAGARVVSYYDAVERVRLPQLLEVLESGGTVVLVTDAGMPSVSDPGYRLAAAAAGLGIRVTTVPGPSAVTAALAVSGLPVDRFCFEGFLPRKAAERASRLAGLAAEPRTMVFFEAPHRTAATLAALSEAFGPQRRGAVCRELTKTHEEVVRGPLADLVVWAQHDVRGEVTLVVAGADPAQRSGQDDPTALAAAVAARIEAGQDRKEAIAAVAAASAVPKRVVFDAVVAAKPTSLAASGSRPPPGPRHRQ